MAPSNDRRGGNRGDGVLDSAAQFWRRSYAPDYVGFGALVAGYMVLVFFVEPFHRMFSISDLAISFPHAEHERVPVFMNIVYAAAVPLAVVVATNLATRASAHKHHVAILGLAVGLVLTSFLTDVVKNAVGRPRPDLLARCKPRPGTAENRLVDWTVCTEKEHHLLHDGWRSFPSGHSSFSFAGLGYTALFLAGQLRIFAYDGERDGEEDGSGAGKMERVVSAAHGRGLGTALFCMIPLLGATMIAISRCQDYRHDVYDVCTGALLGSVVTYWSYRRYWPRLGSYRCSEPWPSPGAVEDRGKGYARMRRDEESGVRGGGGSSAGYSGGYEMRIMER
ncbi:hypothetical protein ACKVWC_005576 [Pyricularia oryzae]